MRRPGGVLRTAAFLALDGWTLLPLVVLVVVAFSGGWLFPSLLGTRPGTPGWSVLGGGPDRVIGFSRPTVAGAARRAVRLDLLATILSIFGPSQ